MNPEFSSAPLVRNGEEQERYHTEPAAPTAGGQGGSRHEASGQLTPKTASECRMKKRAFWLASLALVITALCLQVGALNKASGTARDMARVVSAPEDQKQQLKTGAKSLAKASGALAFVGIVSAVLSVVCLYVSFRKREPAKRSVLVGLLAFYLLLLFIEV